MQSLPHWIPQASPPPKRQEVTKSYLGFNYAHITTTYPSGRVEESFECNCHTEATEVGIKAFMDTVFN